MSHFLFVLIAAAILSLGVGCGGKKEITSLQRKEAATLESEAQFALTLKDYTRAEDLLARAAQLVPDAGPLWLRLGSTRMKLGQRGAAKEAYKNGLDAFKEVAKDKKNEPDASLQQVTALALLGRIDEARKLVEKLAREFPENRTVRAFVDEKTFERMIADPQFKEIAL